MKNVLLTLILATGVTPLVAQTPKNATGSSDDAGVPIQEIVDQDRVVVLVGQRVALPTSPSEGVGPGESLLGLEPIETDGNTRDGSEEPSVGYHYRILGVKGAPLYCESPFYLFVYGDTTPIETDCDLRETYEIRVRVGSPLPFMRLSYGADLMEDSEVEEILGGCRASGGGSGDIKVVGNQVVVTVNAWGKVKCFGRTVLEASKTITCRKRLSDISLCVDCRDKSGPIIVEGKICYAGAAICFREPKIKVDFRGREYHVATLPDFCVPLVAATDGHNEPHHEPTLAPKEGEAN